MDAQSDASIEDEIGGLYRLGLGEFVAARNQLAKRLARDGARAHADRVKALPKPNVAAWATNQLWWRYREDFDALLSAGRSLREGGGEPAMRARKHAIARLLDHAAAILRESGHADPISTLRRIGQNLGAAAAKEVPELGRLASDLEAPGFEVMGAGPFASVAARADPDAHARAQARQAISDAQGLQRRAEDAATRASARAAALREEATLARTRAEETRVAAERADAAAREAEREAERARADVEAATETVRRSSTDKP